MQDRKDFLGSKHLGGDLSCEKLAIEVRGAVVGVRGQQVSTP